jgi:hypothetical protein
MPWLYVSAALAWLAGWVWLGAGYTARAEGEVRVARFSRLIPAFAALTCLVTFVALPHRGTVLQVYTLWAHHASFCVLFLFLSAAQYLQAEAWWRLRRGDSAGAIARTYRRLWTLTETVPGPAALVILLTGLRLIWESPANNSLSQTWLLYLVIGFSVFFWDGILGYRPVVHLLWRWAERSPVRHETGAILSRPPKRWSLQLAMHFASWPVLFLIGSSRWSEPNSATELLAMLEERASFLPTGWPQVTMALAVWLLVGALIRAGSVVWMRFSIFDSKEPSLAKALPPLAGPLD